MKTAERKQALMPDNNPRYIRVFDNGGKTFDRYTVIFTKKSITDKESRKHYGQLFMYVGMSENPFHPQGFGQHGELSDPRGGKHLGKRITFNELPKDCKALVVSDYIDLWDIKDDNKLPTVMDYKKFLDSVCSKFKITINEARDKYGLFTYAQWHKLLDIC